MNSDIINTKAKLTLYSTENGGRETGIGTGYRPNHVMNICQTRMTFRQPILDKLTLKKTEFIEEKLKT